MKVRESAGSVLARTGLLVATCLVCVLGMELFLHATLDEVNFLKPRLIDDDSLGHRVEPGSAGHDQLGFRNASVPEQVDILAIGDSQTYGVSAMAMNSWPAWLTRLTGHSVYSAALGGYGPIQYEYLLRTHGLAMNPKIVVVGLYFGNDIADAHRVVYGLESWNQLRLPNRELVVQPYQSVENRPPGSLPSIVRLWLARHSILYRLTATAAGQMLGPLDMAIRDLPPGIVIVSNDSFQTALTPLMRLGAVDLEHPEIDAGLELTLTALDRIATLCDEHEIRLVVLLIPTKETVFAPWLEDRADLPHANETSRLLRFESELRTRVSRHLKARGVTVVDPVDAMRRQLEDGPIYPSNEGGHPVSDGYRAIAEAVSEVL